MVSEVDDDDYLQLQIKAFPLTLPRVETQILPSLLLNLCNRSLDDPKNTVARCLLSGLRFTGAAHSNAACSSLLSLQS